MNTHALGALVTVLAVAACPTERAADPNGAPPAPTGVTSEKAEEKDPLPSWNESASKKAIVDFVARVTKVGGPDFVPVEERIATFDNDGTLWAEKPVYAQLAFAFDRVKTMAAQHPAWKTQQPFKAVLDGDMKAVAESGEAGIMKIIAATHTGNTTAEFEQIVKDWIATAKHPTMHQPYTDMVYVPMLELLAYLRDNDFKTFMVTGGGVEFVRPWAERVYGIAPEQLVGSRVKTKYEMREGGPVLFRLPEVDLVDDKTGKPIGINQLIGRRPLMAFGNSDGDLEMLQWTTSAPGPRFGLLVHHTDGVREWAYDRNSYVGRLSTALDDAPKNGWVVVDMKNDWNSVFAFEQRPAVGR